MLKTFVRKFIIMLIILVLGIAKILCMYVHVSQKEEFIKLILFGHIH